MRGLLFPESMLRNRIMSALSGREETMSRDRDTGGAEI